MEIIDIYEEKVFDSNLVCMKVKSPHLSEDQSIIYLPKNETSSRILQAWKFQLRLIEQFGKEKIEYLQNNCPEIARL